MFRHLTGKKNRQLKQPKTRHQDYLYIERQPYNDDFAGISESELEQHISIHDMRRAFKRSARKLRALYAAEEPTHKSDRLAKMRLAKT